MWMTAAAKACIRKRVFPHVPGDLARIAGLFREGYARIIGPSHKTVEVTGPPAGSYTHLQNHRPGTGRSSE